jgi:hypothetical protein
MAPRWRCETSAHAILDKDKTKINAAPAPSRPFGRGGLGTNARPSGRLGRLFRNYLFIYPCRHVCRSLALPRNNKRGGNGGNNHKRGNGCGDFAQSRFGKRSDPVTGCDSEQPGDGNANRGSGIDMKRILIFALVLIACAGGAEVGDCIATFNRDVSPNMFNQNSKWEPVHYYRAGV